MMQAQTRKTGIDVIGDLPWGTHLCLFYHTKEDLIGILVPYFKAGLENNEFCMWVISEPLSVEEATRSLKGAVDNLDHYIQAGQMEILDHSQWYTKSKGFDVEGVLQGWVDKENLAVRKGFDGLRFTGNAFWPEEEDWRVFTEYEAAVDGVISQYRMLAICTYSLEMCGASEVIDVVSNHQFALIKREGEWVTIQSAQCKRAEEALRESKELFEKTFTSLRDAIFLLDARSPPTILNCNPATTDVFGYTRQEMLGRTTTFLHVDDTALRKFQEYLYPAIAEHGFLYLPEFRMKRKDGTVFPTEHSVMQLEDEQGQRIGWVSVVRDITERKRAEEALRESEERYRTLFEGLPIGLYRSTPEGQIVDANSAMANMLGYPDRESMRAVNAVDLYVNSEDRKRWQALMEHQGIVRDFEVQLRKHDGTPVWVRGNARVVRNAEGHVLYYEGALEDITERKRVEEALRESEEKYRNLVERANDGIAIVQDGIIKYVNPVLARMAGYSIEELIGTPFTDYVHPGELPKVVDRYKRRMAGEDIAPIYEIVVRHKEGGEIYVELNAGMITYQGKPADLVIVRDITERRRMEAQVRAQDRLAAVGQLAAGIAHDFNNILTGMMGFAELVHMRTDVPESAKADLKRIMEGGQRAAHLIRQILDFSRRSLISPRPLNLGPFLQETVRFLQRTIPESIPIVLEIGPDAYWVHADPTRIQQALTNLAVNARDAMPGGGELRFRLSRFTLKPEDRRPFPSMKPGEWITLSVSDTGTGIPPEVVPHLYEPFFTTKAPGEGTGLGLAQVYGIVKQHGGFIDVKTEVGKGTTFIIYLPPLAVQEEAPRGEPPVEMPRGQGEVILVVEDEPQVLRVSQAMLEHLGYRVLTAPTGVEAIEIYGEHGKEIALVLADMVMPRMGGVELFRALRGRNSEVRMVVMTGYALGREERELLEQGIVDWILKPPDLGQLARVVREAMK